jgi:hypothetical protein
MTQNVVDFSGNPSGSGLMDDYLDKDQQNVLTSNSGIQRPSYAVAGTKWLDTSVTPWLWKMYDGTSDVTLGTVNPSTHLFTPDGILPSQDGQSGKFLQTNGGNTLWADAVDYTQITNCITKIPQDIKLELADGVLTLKVGSKVYVPNGAGKFDEVTISNDLSSNSFWTTNKVMLVLNKNYNGFYSFVLENQYSGATEPSNPNAGTIWYDTTNNLIKRYSGTYWESGQSFPICIANMVSGTGVTSIDQVFNGFGFIGSCLFALPGVKLLMPNGRNSDGSLNNFEYTTLNPAVSEEIPGNNDYFLGFTSGGGFKRNQVFSGFYVSDSFISTSSQWCLLFNTTDNFYYSTGDYGATWNKYTLLAQIGTFTGNNGKISRLNVRQPFRAVDYYDYAREVDNAVHKTGNETIFGRKTFTGLGVGIIKSGSAIYIQNPNVDLSITDGSVYGTTEIHFKDKNGIVQGIFEHQNRTSGDSVVIMAARNHANTAWTSMEVGFDKNDKAFAKAPTPPSSSNSGDIANTGWVRKYGAQLDYSAAITISGTGEKTASVNGVLIGTPIYNNRSEQLKIIIGGKTFYFAPGNSGEDNNHISQCYLPIAKDQSYNVVEINNNVQLLLVPYV